MGTAQLLFGLHASLIVQALGLLAARVLPFPAPPRAAALWLLLARETLALLLVRSLGWHSVAEREFIDWAQSVYAQARLTGGTEGDSPEFRACLGRLCTIQNRRVGTVRSLLSEHLRFCSWPAVFASCTAIALLAVERPCVRIACSVLLGETFLRGCVFLLVRAQEGLGAVRLWPLVGLSLAGLAAAWAEGAVAARQANSAGLLSAFFCAWLAAEALERADESPLFHAPRRMLYALLRGGG